MSRRDKKPVVRDQDIISALHGVNKGIRIGQLETLLSLPHQLRPKLKERLFILENEGLIKKEKGGKYILGGGDPVLENTHSLQEVKKTTGKLQIKIIGSLRVTPGGVGFVTRDDGQEDVFIAPPDLGGALDMDKVSLTVWSGRRGSEGRVESIVTRGRTKITGVIAKKAGRYTFQSDDPRINSKVKLLAKPSSDSVGKVVLAEIIKYPEFKRDPIEVEIESIIGEPGILTTEIEKTIIVAGIVEKFPDDVLETMQKVPDTVLKDDFLNREDFRNLDFLTIDPVDARDFDDAIYCEENEGGYKLYVAIADVSHYVFTGTLVDEEARKRGLSVYLPDRSIPMLPPVLSSGICSLKPDVERLSMVCIMDFNAKGQRTGYEIHPAVIKSKARLSYKDVAGFLSGKNKSIKMASQIATTKKLTDKLHTFRIRRGALEMEIPEAKVILDEDDPLRVRDIIKSKVDEWTGMAYNLVEECMLAANEAVGHFITQKNIPVPWRVHEEPDEERLENFKTFAKMMGIDPGKAFDEGGRLNKVFKKISEHAASRPLYYSLLRSLKQARYSEENLGHYALAAKTYLHFTSPIRRYPDLAVHRALKAYWASEGRVTGNEKKLKIPTTEEAILVSNFASGFERRAVTVERKVTDIYRAWFMVPKIGQMYVATVSSITAFGIFLSIEDPFVEGMIRLEWIDEDTMRYVEEAGVLVGEKTKRIILPGDSINIIVAKADVVNGKISFEPEGSVFELIPERKSFKIPKPAKPKKDQRGGSRGRSGGSSYGGSGGGSRGGSRKSRASDKYSGSRGGQRKQKSGGNRNKGRKRR